MNRATAEEIEAHLETCVDGPDCQVHRAQAWAEQVAKKEHVPEVRDLLIAMHLAEAAARDRDESCETLTDILATLISQAPAEYIRIDQNDMMRTRAGNLLVEEHDDGTLVLSMIPLSKEHAA